MDVRSLDLSLRGLCDYSNIYPIGILSRQLLAGIVNDKELCK